MQVTSPLTCSYFQPISKEYLSTRQIFSIGQLTAVSAAHFDVSIAIQGQTVQK